jgi:hypothetical protein
VKTNLRVTLVRLACVGIASYVGWPLLDIEPPQKPLELMKPVAQRVRIHAPMRQVVEAKRDKVIIRSTTAPKKPIVAKTEKKVDAPLPPDPAPEPVVQEPTPVPPPQEIPKLFLNQPSIPLPLPPVPPDDLPGPAYFNDKPGGSVVVLAIQLNSDNIVVMTDILVESSTPFNDLTFAMTTRGMQWKNVSPPIPPGQFRWLEIRLDYDTEKDNSSVLP